MFLSKEGLHAKDFYLVKIGGGIICVGEMCKAFYFTENT